MATEHPPIDQESTKVKREADARLRAKLEEVEKERDQWRDDHADAVRDFERADRQIGALQRERTKAQNDLNETTKLLRAEEHLREGVEEELKNMESVAELRYELLTKEQS